MDPFKYVNMYINYTKYKIQNTKNIQHFRGIILHALSASRQCKVNTEYLVSAEEMINAND